MTDQETKPARGTEVYAQYKELRLLNKEALMHEAYAVIKRAGFNTDDGVRLRAIMLNFYELPSRLEDAKSD